MMNLLITFAAALLHLMHPFYVSLTELSYNEKSGAVEVSVRIFTSDLEQILKTKTTAKVDLIHGEEAANSKLIQTYIGDHLRIEINNVRQTMHYIGFEEQGESIWAYFEIRNVAAVNSVSVHNTLLYDFIKEQINLVQVRTSTNSAMQKLSYPQQSAVFKF